MKHRFMTPERKSRIQTVLAYRQPDLTVIMENVADHHNIAAVMRTCDAVGVQEIYVLNTVIDKHMEFSWQSSRSANKWITVHQFDDVETCFNAVKKKYDKIFATNFSASSQSLYELNLTQSVALLFGNERKGISKEVIPYCDGNFIIPQVGMIKSLNISVACAISLYEAFRQRELAGNYNGQTRLDANTHAYLAKEWGFPLNGLEDY